MAIEAPRSLLVLKPSSFGDIVHTLPAVSRLKAAWPECRVSWLANSEWMPLLSGNPDVDEVIEYPVSDFAGWSVDGRWQNGRERKCGDASPTSRWISRGCCALP